MVSGLSVKLDDSKKHVVFCNLSVVAYRAILLVGLKMKESPLHQGGESKWFTISPSEYHYYYGKSDDKSLSYRAIKRSVEDFLCGKFIIKEVGSKGKATGGKEMVISLADEVRYDEEEKALKVRLSSYSMHAIRVLTVELTEDKIYQVSKLGSRHSIHLYELAKKWGDESGMIETPEIPIQLLRQWLSVRDDLHAEVKIFNRDVVKKSINEISKKTDIQLSSHPSKEGREIVSYVFKGSKK